MKVILTGGAGFLGYSVTTELAKQGHKIYAIVRPGSNHNERIANLPGVMLIEGDISANDYIPTWQYESCDCLIHLANAGARNDAEAQHMNVVSGLKMVDLAKSAGCKRIVYTGSQAEYGATVKRQVESLPTNPFCEYGKAKVELCEKSRIAAEKAGIEWVWGRIFSLYGQYEPMTRMLPQLIAAMKNGEEYKMSSGNQNWDYLEVRDGARAVIALMESGKSGEIYNIANGDYCPLRAFTEIVRAKYPQGRIIYGDDPVPYVSLQPDVSKIKRDTGWAPKFKFEDTLDYV